MARRVAIILALIAGALVLTLAVPYGPWRTGRLELEPLVRLPPHAAPQPPSRIWIDTDAACGHGPRTDPDDCFALLALVQGARQRIAGVSTVAGNAPHEVTDPTARELVRLADPSLAVHSGHEALRKALEAGPLTIVALGPLTNIAAALRGHPRLAVNVERLIAVMGRRPGHLFHPAEGAKGAMLLGHGPVFRDFNFELDRQAAAQVLALDIPLTLVPYDAARSAEITAADLDRMAAQGGASAWVAARSRGWLRYWNEDMGRAGFYPFDLLAARYALEPRDLVCASVQAGIGRDPMFRFSWSDSLLVAHRREELGSATRARPAIYCLGLTPVSAKASLPR